MIFDELVQAAQAADVKKEEERLKAEALEKQAWLARAKAPGTYNMSQLLEKMYGSGAEVAQQKLDTPKPTKEERKPDAASKFPPPPTKR